MKNEELFTSSWTTRVSLADRDFEEWEKKFKCKELEKYYEGVQNIEDNGYILNLIFSTWATKSPTLLFRRPEFNFQGRPEGSDFDIEGAISKSLLASDMVNTLVNDPDMKFADNCAMAILDVGAYFGCVEVGYSANWKRNPKVGQAYTNQDDNPEAAKLKLTEPEMIPESEWVYVKRVPAHRIRVGGNQSWDENQNAWVGYYEWFRTQDLKNTDNKDSKSPTDAYVNTDDKVEGYDKIWKIWDLRRKVFFIFNQTQGKIEYEPEPFKRLPLKFLRFSKRRKGFYPLPVFWNWKSSQDDYNDARTQLRNHRRRSKRLYQALKDTIDEEEKIKAAVGPDGTIIETKVKDALGPVQNGPADSSIIQTLQISKDDFNVASLTSAEKRGQSDRVTATQAAITAKFASINDQNDRETVADWLNSIGLEILHLALDNFTLPIWIQRLSDTPQSLGQEVQTIQQRWELLNAENLRGLKFTCNVTVSSLSPITNDEEKTKMMEVLAVLNQYPLMSLHPTIIREICFRIGYRNEQVIMALQQMAQLQVMAKIAEGSMNIGGINEGAVSQRTVEQMQPPSQGQIENQIAQQGVPVA